MKNHLLSLLVALVATVSSLPMAAQEAYAVLTEADSTLTFYYDNQRSTRRGTVYNVPSGDEPAWAETYSAQQEKIKHAVFDASFAGYRPTSTYCWFNYCTKLQDIQGMENLNTENVTDMWGMFNSCWSLKSLDVTHFNTENVTNMGSMFYCCESLTSLDMSHFNTANVTNMSSMFDNCHSLISLDVTHFNTTNVTDMNSMFNFSYSLTSLDVSHFNTANVTNMSSMFCGCSSLPSLDVSHFNTEKVTNMSYMFYSCNSLTSLDVSHFNTANVTNMSSMFSTCYSLTTIFCNDDWKEGGKVEKHEGMFNNCNKLKGEHAVYDANKTGIEMANPTTGYFTVNATGIDNVKADDKTGDGKTYDLSGRRVNKNYKGIVIRNGRKTLQR
jgi:surface protein